MTYRASREAIYFIFAAARTCTYVRPVALSARHVFFFVGHPVAAAAICELRCVRAHVCEARSDKTVPRLAERVSPLVAKLAQSLAQL